MITPKVVKPPVPSVKTVRIVSQPPNTGVRTGGFFAALTPQAQAVALQNPVLLATPGQVARQEARWGPAAGWYDFRNPLVAPNQGRYAAAHEQAHAIMYETLPRVSMRPLMQRYNTDNSFHGWANRLYGGTSLPANEVFTTMLSALSLRPTAISGWRPNGLRETFAPFVNRAYLWPHRPGPRVTGGY